MLMHQLFPATLRDPLPNHLTCIGILLMAALAYPLSAAAQTATSKSYHNGVVVSADQKASEIGADILKRGGNAIDAAVAVNFVLAVTHPQAGNIGGGGYMMIKLSDGTTRALDFREKAPRKASEDMYQDLSGNYQPEWRRSGALAAGVPGTVDGMVRALQRYGNLPIDEVLEPAIKLATEGHKLSYATAHKLNRYREELSRYASSREYYTKEHAKFVEGQSFVQKDLGATLSRISDHGIKGFYSLETADMIEATVRKNSGLIDKLDLRRYDSEWREPIRVEFRDKTLHMMPPSSSGGAVLAEMINMLKSFNLTEIEYRSPEYYHMLAEIMRRAFADRSRFLGDPEFVDVPLDSLSSRNFARNRIKSFSWGSATRSRHIAPGDISGFKESYETTHFSIVDKQGNAVAVTTTLNGNFGSKLSVAGAGFLLNNEMDDFAAPGNKANQFGLVEGRANRIEPGKRMLSSMSPTIVTNNSDGKVDMVLGAAGGPRIINTVFQTFLHSTLFGMNAQQAIAAPRIHHQWKPDSLYFESYTLSVSTKKQLQKLGHRLSQTDHIGRGHIIMAGDNGAYQSGVDPRGYGYAAGY